MELADDQQAQTAEEQPEATDRIVSPGKRSPLVTIVALFYILLWSSAFIATKIGVTHSPPLTLLSVRFLSAALHLVFVISTGASLLWFWLLKRGEASSVSAYYFLTPIAGLALAALLLGEPFGVRDVFGLVAVAAGIALINRPMAANPFA